GGLWPVGPAARDALPPGGLDAYGPTAPPAARGQARTCPAPSLSPSLVGSSLAGSPVAGEASLAVGARETMCRAMPLPPRTRRCVVPGQGSSDHRRAWRAPP